MCSKDLKWLSLGYLLRLVQSLDTIEYSEPQDTKPCWLQVCGFGAQKLKRNPHKDCNNDYGHGLVFSSASEFRILIDKFTDQN